ncbi:hypothetical protein KKF34_08600 [Myxococcota bacterium]|nr:hypothetical protein [Myxococcota bacterium]MBU1382922.1 hypothetical protein [Myxococcota bacterium]MBU1496923.1 hypothetical protein [Myxococcota bacterium]
MSKIETMKLQFFFILFFVISACDTPFGEIRTETEKKNKIAEKTKKRRKINIKKSIKDYPNCIANTWCKPESDINRWLRSQSKSEQYKILEEMFLNGSIKVKRLALLKLYAFRGEVELNSLLKKHWNSTENEDIKTQALTLLFLSGKKESIEFATSQWSSLSGEIQKRLLWVVADSAQGLPPTLIEEMSKSELPEVKTVSLQLQSLKSNNIEVLVTCINNNDKQSGLCIDSLLRFRNRESAEKLLKIINRFLEDSRNTKRRLELPPELMKGLYTFMALKLLDEKQVFETAVSVLGNRRLGDRIRSRAAYVISDLKHKNSRQILEKFRKDNRRRVGYAARRALYLLERNG